jgi:hypothetical protein
MLLEADILTGKDVFEIVEVVEERVVEVLRESNATRAIDLQRSRVGGKL